LDAFIAEAAAAEFWTETPLRWLRGRIRLARGDAEGAKEDADRALDRAESAKDPQVLWPARAFGARVFAATDKARAEGLVSELLTEWQEHDFGIGGDIAWLSDIAVALVALGTDAELPALVERSRVKTPWRKAAAAYVSGDFQAAAAEYSAIGAQPEEAYARLQAAKSLVGEGRWPEADSELRRSLAFWRSVRATAYLHEGERLVEAGASADAGRSGTK
jgi:hypothetical protein